MSHEVNALWCLLAVADATVDVIGWFVLGPSATTAIVLLAYHSCFYLASTGELNTGQIIWILQNRVDWLKLHITFAVRRHQCEDKSFKVAFEDKGWHVDFRPRETRERFNDICLKTNKYIFQPHKTVCIDLTLRVVSRCSYNGPLTRYVKLRVVHASGMPWCMSGSLTRGGGENVTGVALWIDSPIKWPRNRWKIFSGVSRFTCAYLQFSLESRNYSSIFSNNSRFLSNYFQITPLFTNDSPMMKLLLSHLKLLWNSHLCITFQHSWLLTDECK